MFPMTFNSTPQSIVDIFLTQKNKNIYNQMASLTFLKKLASCDSYYYVTNKAKKTIAIVKKHYK